jgi:hypothetical protein
VLRAPWQRWTTRGLCARCPRVPRLES